MPLSLVRLLATLTHNQELKAVGEMMAYFDKVGEGNYQASSSDVLGVSTTTLDKWLQRRKAKIRVADAES